MRTATFLRQAVMTARSGDNSRQRHHHKRGGYAIAEQAEKRKGIIPGLKLGSRSITKRRTRSVAGDGQTKRKGTLPGFKLGSIQELDVAIIATP